MVSPLAVLAEHGQRFIAESDPVMLLDLACRTIREETGATLAIAAIFDESSISPAPVLTSGCDRESTEQLRSAEVPSAFREVARSGRLMREPVDADARLGLPASHPPLTAFMIAPLAAASHVHGVLAVASAGAVPFSDGDEHLVRMLAGFAGMAYHNAVLINHLRSKAAALQESQTTNEFVLAATGVGLYQRDLTTGHSTSSRSLTTLLEVGDDPTIEELRRRLQPDDREALLAATATALADRADYHLDVKVTLSDGAVRDIYARGRVTSDAHGAPGRLMGAFIDLTERRLLEAQLRQAQKMEIIGRMAGGVAHDFNNLLTVIAGYARFLEPELTTNEGAQKDLGEILKAVDRATSLTRQLLAFTRKRARELTIFDVNTLITDLASMSRRLLGEHVKLITTLDPAAPPIHADRGLVEQALLNLVINARDAMPQGGELRIRTRAVTDAAGTWSSIAVADTGTGMSPEVQAQIFEPFFTTKPEGKGTGLGLATVLAIVSDFGGRISVESAPGKGTVFTIVLPATSAPVTERAIDRAAAPGGTERILLVEDDEAVRELSQSILERAGYVVHPAASVADAIAIIDHRPIDAMVTDVVIAGGTGPGIYRHAARRRPNLRVLFVSGYAPDTILDTSSLDAHAAFLPKPFTAASLLRRLRSLLDRS
jgi:two-component system cell cycle sensor histidine kinase/response regulator CckA